jgi:hypothetical protein
VLPVESGSKVWEEDEAFAAQDDAWAWVGIGSRSAITLQVLFLVLGKGFGVGFEPNTFVGGFAKVDSRRCYLEMVVEKSAELGRAVEVETFELRSVPEEVLERARLHSLGQCRYPAVSQSNSL